MSKQELVDALEKAMKQMQYDQPTKGGGYVIGNKPAKSRQELLDNWTVQVLKGGK